jgi:hypothetical protein
MSGHTARHVALSDIALPTILQDREWCRRSSSFLASMALDHTTGKRVLNDRFAAHGAFSKPIGNVQIVPHGSSASSLTSKRTPGAFWSRTALAVPWWRMWPQNAPILPSRQRCWSRRRMLNHRATRPSVFVDLRRFLARPSDFAAWWWRVPTIHIWLCRALANWPMRGARRSSTPAQSGILMLKRASVLGPWGSASCAI